MTRVYGNADFLPVVLGTNLNTYNIARSLHEAYGVRTLALGRVALRETADSRIVGVRTYPDLDDPARIVEVLLELAAEFPGRKRLLIANIEHYTNAVLANRDVLALHYLIPLAGPEVAARLMTKSDFARTCAELGVPHPESIVAPAAQVAAEGFGEDLPFPFPVILKPSDTDAYPRLRFAGKQKVYVVPDAASVREIAARIVAAGYSDELVVQEYLAGDESVMQVVNTYSDRHGRMRLCSAAQIVLGEYDPQYVGNYNAVVTMSDPALTESVRHLLDSVGYVGAANVDVMVDPRTGTAKLLEVNLRQGAASFYTMAAGANLARCYVEDLVYEREVPELVPEVERLWVNVPYPVVRALVPRSLRARVRRARRHGVTHTLRYRHDGSLRRRVAVARLDLRVALGYLKNLRTRPGR
ncbi:MAG: ATP-grasp domain-containing protein [Actinomycetota bacterium]|nr:ATP-grasp domain-containing protein [Actinomycetota bacterium]